MNTSSETPDWLKSFDPKAPEHLVLQHGRNLTVRTSVEGREVVVKCFPPPSGFQKKLDALAHTKPKALRAYNASKYLDIHFPGSTPEPLGFLLAPSGSGLFASAFEPNLTSFTAKLVELYRSHGPGCDLIALLERVAKACRKLHDCGFFHGDLGNQNIALTPDDRIFFIDLNRCKTFPDSPSGVPLKLRARDLSRIALPSDFLRCFFEMYWEAPVPKEFAKAEKTYRRRFAWHTASRKYRHPFRPRKKAPDPVYPAPQDIWIWDTCSEQALVTMRSKDRRRYQSASRVFIPLFALLRYSREIFYRMKRLRRGAFEQSRLALANRAFISISADPDRFEKELDYILKLNCTGVHVRFYAHDSKENNRFKIDAVHKLFSINKAVAISLVQDREAVKAPRAWLAFCTSILDEVKKEVIWVEYLHAVNRVKWGIWNFKELETLLNLLVDLRKRYPTTSFLVPSTIDFEWDFFAGALSLLPSLKKLEYSRPIAGAAVELYVDRRGPPEAKQGRFNALGKLRLFRSIVHAAKSVENHLVVTEFNWPLAKTGVWSPVGSPYESPGPRFNDPSVSEAQAACYTLRYLLLGLCSGHADCMVFWSLAAHGFGLIDPGTKAIDTWRTRPAFDALKFYFEALRNGSYTDAPLRGENGVWLLRFLSWGGPRIAIAWTTDDVLEKNKKPSLAAQNSSLTAFDILGSKIGFHVEEITDMFGHPVSPQEAKLSPSPLYFFEHDPLAER